MFGKQNLQTLSSRRKIISLEKGILTIKKPSLDTKKQTKYFQNFLKNLVINCV